MTNPSHHNIKAIRNAPNLLGINIRLMYALDMLWIGGLVSSVTEHTIREFGNSPCHEMVNVIRNCPDGNRFVPIH